MTVLPRDHAWTVDDLDTIPDDGLRYELVDGMLLVSPAPTRTHQRCQATLFRLLDPLVPTGFELLMAPVDYRPTQARSLQPDLLIASRADPGEKSLSAALLLAVEIVSPSSRSVDLLLKRGLYEEAGVHHYWVVDPEQQRLHLWSRSDDAFGEPVIVEPGQTHTLHTPFAVVLDSRGIFNG